jgi:hypothetical protein
MKTIECGVINLGAVISQMKAPEYVMKRLLDEANELKISHNQHLAGHLDTQLSYPKETVKWFYSEIVDYWNAYLQIYCNFNGIESKTIHFSSKVLWVNHMKKGDYNPLHTHDGDLTFVMYLDIPNEIHEEQNNFIGKSAPPGSIEFKYKLDEYHDGITSWQWGKSSVFLTPKTGDFFIFPAGLHHSVSPFKSDVTRISVSGNLEIINKKDISLNNF